MRVFSGNVNALISGDDVATFYLVDFGGAGFTSLPEPVTLDGDITYAGSDAECALLTVEPPRLSADVDKAPYKVVFADPAYKLKDAFNSGAQTGRLRVRLGFFNTIRGLRDRNGVTIPLDTPLTGVEDTVLVYSGYIDKCSYNVDFSGSNVQAIVEGAAPMGDLDAVRGYFACKDFATSVPGFETDTSYDKIQVDAAQMRFKWGKA